MQLPLLRGDWTWIVLCATPFPALRQAAGAAGPHPPPNRACGSSATVRPPQHKLASGARVTLWDEIAPPPPPLPLPLPLPSEAVSSVQRGAADDLRK